MVRAAGFAASFLLSISPVLAHDPFILDARRATPGPRLELIELPAVAGSSEKKYRLRVGAGLPRGVTFGVFTKPFDHAFHEAASGFRLDESGSLVSDDSGGAGRHRLDAIAFGPGRYPAGAPWEVALVSSDRDLRIFARVVPYPIVATDGSCRVSLELASHLGDRFSASGAGFPPGEEVTSELRYSGRQIQKHVRISPEGLLPPDPLSHRPIGADRSAHYTVAARTCRVTIDYDWGEPALIRR